MPWLTIIITLLSFFVSKRNGMSDTSALLTAGLAGAGTYYVTHETDWGKANLGDLDGAPPTTTGGTSTGTNDTSGTPVPKPGTGTTTSGTSIWDVFKSWGATGTALVTGVAAGATGLTSWLPLIAIGVVAYLVLK